jgi:uncharacterized SAM-binding protein YcdF (DUF218 family)
LDRRDSAVLLMPGSAEDLSAPPPMTGPDRDGHGRWWRRPSGRVVCLTLALIVATPLITTVRVWYVARQDDRRRSDAIVVLGAVQFNGHPSPVLEWRLRHALELFRHGVAPRIITVGGNRPGDRYTEAHAGKDWLGQHRVPPAALDSVPTGNDTLHSIVAVAREFQNHHWRSAVIVTDPWHSLRSATMARDNGIDAVTSPARGGPTVGTRHTEANYILRETGGYLYYVMIGRYR